MRVEVEVARWPSGIITTVPKSKPSVQTQTTAVIQHEQESLSTWIEPPAIAVDDDHIALPSVKELAKQFSMLEEMEKVHLIC